MPKLIPQKTKLFDPDPPPPRHDPIPVSKVCDELERIQSAIEVAQQLLDELCQSLVMRGVKPAEKNRKSDDEIPF